MKAMRKIMGATLLVISISGVAGCYVYSDDYYYHDHYRGHAYYRDYPRAYAYSYSYRDPYYYGPRW